MCSARYAARSPAPRNPRVIAPACHFTALPPLRAVADIRTLLLNMQHLINAFRPFQAREELIAAVQAQVDSKQRLLDGLRDACDEAARLSVVDDEAHADTDAGGSGASEAAATARGAPGWELGTLERLLGTSLVSAPAGS